MNRSGFRLAALGAAGLLLTGCGSEAIDAGTAGDLQAEVRTIASTAAAGDPTGAIRLAQDLKVDVENARSAGEVTEDRAVLIGMRLDAVITSLEADRVPAGDAPTGEQAAPTEETTEETLEEPTEEPTGSQAPAETVSPAEPAPVSPVPAPVQPAPTPDPVQPAPTPTPEEDAEEDAEDAEDPWSEDAGEEAVQGEEAVPDEQDRAEDRAAERAAEQQRKAEEKAREAAEKAAEKAEKAQESGKKGKPDE